MKKIISLVFLIMLSSCNQNPVNEKYEKKTLEDKYSLLIPESLGVTTELNNEASLQFQNVVQDFYVIVLDESRTDFVNAVENKSLHTTPDLDGYYSFVAKHFKEITPKDFKLYNIEKKRINSKNAIVFSMSGISGDYNVFYRYAVIQSNERYYQIMTWTNVNQERKYTERMNKIIQSFTLEGADAKNAKSHLAKEKAKK